MTTSRKDENVIAMSTKKNGMAFEMLPTPAKGKDGKTLYYPRPLGGQKISMKELDAYCARNYGLRPFELTRAFEAFMMATGYLIAEGHRVETPIGAFAPRLRVEREITDPDDVENRDVHFDGVEYNSGKLWHEAVGKWLQGFHHKPGTNVQEIMADRERLEAKLHDCINKHDGYVTVRLFKGCTGLTYYSAKKLLDQWTEGERPKLLKTKRGQEYIYTEI